MTREDFQSANYRGLISPLLQYPTTNSSGVKDTHLLNQETPDARSPNILVIDDDKELGQLLAEYFALEGFFVTLAHDGEDGLAKARTGNTYDLIVLDVMLPKLDGFDVLKRLRQSHLTPVILLTAKGDDFDRIFGLELGADDYLAKPFNTRELVARVRALLRRIAYSTSTAMQPIITVGQLSIHNQTQKLYFGQELIEVTGTEFAILQLLAVNKGVMTSKQNISRAVFGRPLAPYDRSIDMHVSNVRKKLSRHTKVEIIRTIRGSGYMMIEQ